MEKVLEDPAPAGHHMFVTPIDWKPFQLFIILWAFQPNVTTRW
jgi:hypothetical protein